MSGNYLKEIAEGELASQDNNPEQNVPAMWKRTVSNQGQSNQLAEIYLIVLTRPFSETKCEKVMLKNQRWNSINGSKPESCTKITEYFIEKSQKKNFTSRTYFSGHALVQ